MKHILIIDDEEEIRELLESSDANALDFVNDFKLNLFNTFRSYIDIGASFPIKHKNNIDKIP